MSLVTSLLSPKPRYRFYGSPRAYLSALRHAASFGSQRDQELGRLESEVRALTGSPFASCVPQARFGIYLALKALIRPGQEVIMSPYTIYDVVNMVLAAGGRPVFADIEQASCNISADAIESLISESTGAVMVTHLHGLACDMNRISAICNAHNIPIVEDAAQAFGGRIGKQWLGAIGDVGIYSFGRAKNINAFFGGMVISKDPAVEDAIRSELDQLPYEDTARLVKRIGHCMAGDLMTLPALFSPITFNIFRYAALNDVQSVNKVVQTENNPVRREELPEHYFRRMTHLQARIAREQLEALSLNTAVRTQYAKVYHEGLHDIPQLVLTPLRLDGSHIYLQFPIQTDDRWALVRHLMQEGRDVAVQHMNSVAELEPFADFARDCPVARRVADSVILLPTYPRYGMHDVEQNVLSIRRYFGKP